MGRLVARASARDYAARMLRLAFAFLVAAAPAAQDWTNSGGNAARNGRSPAYGPLTAQLAWSGSRSSIIAWQPVTAGDRVFVVRQTGFPPSGEPNGSPVVCHDLVSGTERWFVHVPYTVGDWTTWVLGASAGQGLRVSRRQRCLGEREGPRVPISRPARRCGPRSTASTRAPTTAWCSRRTAT